ncbi:MULTISPECIES: hypothetical protein, partial [unclassified Mesorhizobium]|uniref:hypothetical protein n=1 Tax=unclassified Mesorhizobium TaxID=325217 RepID=UPI001AECC2F5
MAPASQKLERPARGAVHGKSAGFHRKVADDAYDWSHVLCHLEWSAYIREKSLRSMVVRRSGPFSVTSTVSLKPI